MNQPERWESCSPPCLTADKPLQLCLPEPEVHPGEVLEAAAKLPPGTLQMRRLGKTGRIHTEDGPQKSPSRPRYSGPLVRSARFMIGPI
jgi:hypothetical protein